MCGIAGLMHFNDKPIAEASLQLILKKIAHRGRDHQGIVSISPTLMLGHRRLSIIDLHPHASQPMVLGKHLCITYNGEIYNYLELKHYLSQHQYSFTTSSDTEVLLAAYDHFGKDCVNHLNGMFAFALWDDKKQCLFIARDQLGIKPFYYYHTDALFAFASESQALAHLNQHRLSAQAIYGYLLSMYVPTTDSIFASIKQLPPAHTLTITAKGGLQLERYWYLTHFETVTNTQSSHHQAELKERLKIAVKRQLQSDVPVGGFLSGGIDSGIITAFSSEHSSHYHTYSIAYEGLIDSEIPYAKAVAEKYSTIHTEVYLNASDAMTHLQRALCSISEPIADPAIIGTYILAERASNDGVKVLLNGTGGDEIFAGYTRYSGHTSYKRRLWLSLPRWMRALLHYFPIDMKTKMRASHPSMDMLLSTGGSYPLLASLLKQKENLRQFLQTLAQDLYLPHHAKVSKLYQYMLFDLHTYLPYELLFLLDQMTMAHTVEGRVPLIDIDVVKFAFQFQAKEHLKGGQTKSLLKSIAGPYLGETHIKRKKQGFAGSTFWWVKENFNEFIETIAGMQSLPGFEYFKIDFYANKKELTIERANDIFILYCFKKWHDHVIKPVKYRDGVNISWKR